MEKKSVIINRFKWLWFGVIVASGVGIYSQPAFAGCNPFGCSQSSAAECNPFGCPNSPMGAACTPFGCPTSPQPVNNNPAPPVANPSVIIAPSNSVGGTSDGIVSCMQRLLYKPARVCTASTRSGYCYEWGNGIARTQISEETAAQACQNAR